MLTLKVISMDLEGAEITHLFSGDRINHCERVRKDHALIPDPGIKVWIGKLINTSSTQEFITSYVQIFGADNEMKTDIFIFPHADCFITEGGKTVDSFTVNYK